MIQKTVTRTILILLAFPLLLAACGRETEVEPTPILPPPNISVGGDDTGTEGVIAPGSTPLVENTATVLPTPTLVPTPTPTAVPTQLPIPVTDPPLEAVTSGSMPATSRDLLFLADGAFKRWNQETRSIETLVPGAAPSSRIRTEENLFYDFTGDITNFSVNADGKRAVFARLTFSQPVTRTNPASGTEFPSVETHHELYFMDLVSRETWLLVPRVDNLGRFALANDAQHVAFSGSSLSGASVMGEEGLPVPNMYFLPTGGGNPGAVRQVAQCQRFCSQIAWHPDNNIFTFGDEAALWMQNLAAREPEVMIENQPFDMNTGVEAVAVYAPISWARNGRFLLLWKGGWEGGSRAVFDIPTKAVVDVPNSFVYVSVFPVEVMWMPDDRLYVLRSESGAGYMPQMELWRFQPEQNTIVKEESRVLSDQQVGAKGQQYLENGRFAYALMSEQDLNPASGLFHLTAVTEAPERVNAVPTVAFYPGGAGQVFWPTDGSGALIAMGDGSNRIYYGPTNGSALYDITAMLGAEPHAFHWQPEIVIP